MNVLDPTEHIRAMGPLAYEVMMAKAKAAEAAAAAAAEPGVGLYLWMLLGPVAFLALIVGGALCLTAFTSRGCRRSRPPRPPEKR